MYFPISFLFVFCWYLLFENRPGFCEPRALCRGGDERKNSSGGKLCCQNEPSKRQQLQQQQERRESIFFSILLFSFLFFLSFPSLIALAHKRKLISFAIQSFLFFSSCVANDLHATQQWGNVAVPLCETFSNSKHKNRDVIKGTGPSVIHQGWAGQRNWMKGSTKQI